MFSLFSLQILGHNFIGLVDKFYEDYYNSAAINRKRLDWRDFVHRNCPYDDRVDEPSGHGAGPSQITGIRSDSSDRSLEIVGDRPPIHARPRRGDPESVTTGAFSNIARERGDDFEGDDDVEITGEVHPAVRTPTPDRSPSPDHQSDDDADGESSESGESDGDLPPMEQQHANVAPLMPTLTPSSGPETAPPSTSMEHSAPIQGGAGVKRRLQLPDYVQVAVTPLPTPQSTTPAETSPPTPPSITKTTKVYIGDDKQEYIELSDSDNERDKDLNAKFYFEEVDVSQKKVKEESAASSSRVAGADPGAAADTETVDVPNLVLPPGKGPCKAEKVFNLDVQKKHKEQKKVKASTVLSDFIKTLNLTVPKDVAMWMSAIEDDPPEQPEDHHRGGDNSAQQSSPVPTAQLHLPPPAQDEIAMDPPSDRGPCDLIEGDDADEAQIALPGSLLLQPDETPAKEDAGNLPSERSSPAGQSEAVETGPPAAEGYHRPGDNQDASASPPRVAAAEVNAATSTAAQGASGVAGFIPPPESGLELSQYDNLVVVLPVAHLDTTMEDAQAQELTVAEVTPPAEVPSISPLAEELSTAPPVEMPSTAVAALIADVDSAKSPEGDQEEGTREDLLDYSESPSEALRRSQEQNSVSS